VGRRLRHDYTGLLPYTFGVLDTALSLENMVITAEALGLGSVIIGSVIEHPEKAKEILKLPTHCLALAILCVGYPKEKPQKRPKWCYDVIVCENRYREVTREEVEAYWRIFVISDLERAGQKVKEKNLRKVLKDRNYGISYATHYTEEFIRRTSKKLADYLIKQGLLKLS